MYEEKEYKDTVNKSYDNSFKIQSRLWDKVKYIDGDLKEIDENSNCRV